MSHKWVHVHLHLHLQHVGSAILCLTRALRRAAATLRVEVTVNSRLANAYKRPYLWLRVTPRILYPSVPTQA